MAELLRAGHTAADDPDLIDALQHDLDELQDRRAVRRQLTDLMDARELVAAATERAYEALKAAAR
jgi:predicted  nucleic acid-binding Zn-ribbon protein